MLITPYSKQFLLSSISFLPTIWLYASEEQKAFYLKQLSYLWNTHRPKIEIFRKLNNLVGIVILKKALVDNPKEMDSIDRMTKHHGKI